MLMLLTTKISQNLTNMKTLLHEGYIFYLSSPERDQTLYLVAKLLHTIENVGVVCCPYLCKHVQKVSHSVLFY